MSKNFWHVHNFHILAHIFFFLLWLTSIISDDVTRVDRERRSLTGGKNPLTFRRLESFDNRPTSNSTTLGLERGFDLNLSSYSAGVFEETTVVRPCLCPVGLGASISENVKFDGLGGTLRYIICCCGPVLVIILPSTPTLPSPPVSAIGGSLRAPVRDIGNPGTYSLNHKQTTILFRYYWSIIMY